MVQTLAPESCTGTRVEEKKRDILRAASAVFRRRGLQAAGMREIAAENGMHVGNLYYYFRNKQELLAFCQEDTLAALIGQASRIVGDDDSPRRKLERIVIAHVRLLNETTPGSLAHLEVEALEEPWRGRIRGRRDRYEEIIHELVCEGVDSGDFANVDPDLTTKAVLGALNWTVKWFRQGGPKSALEIGQSFADIFLGGLLARQGAALRG